MVFKLYEIYNTKYFYISYASDLAYLVNALNKVKANPEVSIHAPSPLFDTMVNAVRRGEEIVLDVSGARFTPDTEYYITSIIKCGVDVIDSELPWRSKLFAENKKRILLKTPQTAALPAFTYTSNIKEYIGNLSTEVTYDRYIGMEKAIAFSLFSLIICTRPTIKVSSRILEEGLFEFVERHLNIVTMEKYHTFLMKSEEGLREVDFGAGPVFIQGLGYVDYVDAVSHVHVIPASFGKNVLLHDQTFASLIHSSFTTLQQYQQLRPKFLHEVLAVQEEIVL